MKRKEKHERKTKITISKLGLFYTIFCSCSITGNVSLMVRKLKCIVLQLFTSCRITHHIHQRFHLQAFISNSLKNMIEWFQKIHILCYTQVYFQRNTRAHLFYNLKCNILFIVHYFYTVLVFKYGNEKRFCLFRILKWFFNIKFHPFLVILLRMYCYFTSLPFIIMFSAIYSTTLI